MAAQAMKSTTKRWLIGSVSVILVTVVLMVIVGGCLWSNSARVASESRELIEKYDIHLDLRDKFPDIFKRDEDNPYVQLIDWFDAWKSDFVLAIPPPDADREELDQWHSTGRQAIDALAPILARTDRPPTPWRPGPSEESPHSITSFQDLESINQIAIALQAHISLSIIRDEDNEAKQTFSTLWDLGRWATQYRGISSPALDLITPMRLHTLTISATLRNEEFLDFFRAQLLDFDEHPQIAWIKPIEDFAFYGHMRLRQDNLENPFLLPMLQYSLELTLFPFLVYLQCMDEASYNPKFADMIIRCVEAKEPPRTLLPGAFNLTEGVREEFEYWLMYRQHRALVLASLDVLELRYRERLWPDRVESEHRCPFTDQPFQIEVVDPDHARLIAPGWARAITDRLREPRPMELRLRQ